MSLTTMGIKAVYLPYSELHLQAQSLINRMIGAVCFCEPSVENINSNPIDIPILRLHAPILAGAKVASEIWLSPAELPSDNAFCNGQYDAIQYRFNDEMLFGVISLQESDSLQDATESAYRQIFALIQKLDYPYIYRFWNYMADINGASADVSNGLERYRQFNVGRKEAFLACDSVVGDQLPAACALGLVDGNLSIAFLLGRQAPVAIENPRQINAYEYPEEYGPRTPSFSRATLLNIKQEALLFISGTASIVGHETLHLLDVVAQTKETLANLDAVIAEANRILGEQKFDLNNIYFRVYIRYAADLTLVQAEMQKHIGGTINAVFIQADICRQELLLEIEATAGQISPLVDVK